MALDEQWPSAARLPARPSPRKAGLARLESLSRRIEDSFEARLGVHAVLVPSARAGCAMILRAHGFNRSHFVFIPQWVSHCMWDVVGRYSNPVASLRPAPDAVLAVHKWGTVSRLSKPGRALIVEDSVDTLFKTPRSLFPNGGLYELLSLPKILGTISGGVVLTRDAAAADRLRRLRRDRAPMAPTPYRLPDAVSAGGADAESLALHQAGLKLASARAARAGRTAFMEWEYLEFANVLFDRSSLEHAGEALAGWDQNAATIESRLARAVEADPRLARCYDASAGRLPPVLAVPVADPAAAARAGLQVRRFDVRRRLDRPSYRPVALLPLHFRTTDARFSALLRALVRFRR